jgi:hypothetical protein
VAQEGGLRRQLDVHERRGGLQRDRGQPFLPVQVDRRMNVLDRHGEEAAPAQALPPATPTREARQATAAEDVVATIDRLQQRSEMGLLGRRGAGDDQDQRVNTPRIPPLDRPGPTRRRPDLRDAVVGRASQAA